MNPIEFVNWLKTFFEIVGNRALDQRETSLLKEKLNAVVNAYPRVPQYIADYPMIDPKFGEFLISD